MRGNPAVDARYLSPRVRGTIRPSTLSSRCVGLSPRVRGNRFRNRPPIQTMGSIPACAGEPKLVSPLASAKGVYPRVCGGTSVKYPAYHCAHGLSPRVRGNPLVTER